MRARKSFNDGDASGYMVPVLMWTAIAVMACALVLPPLWDVLGDALRSRVVRAIAPELPRSLPPLGSVRLQASASVFAACLIACAVDLLVRRRRRHDGTWQGGRRAASSPLGDAWLESRPSRIARSMELWREERPCEPGMVVGSIGGVEIVKPFINALLLGAPGSGKTRRVLISTVANLVSSGKASALVLDPKGELRDYTSRYALERGVDVYDLRLDDPARSMRYDVLGPALAALDAGDAGLAVARLRELATIVVPSMPGKNSFFSDAARLLFVGLSMWLLEQDDVPRECKHIGSVRALLTPRGGMSALERVIALAESVPADDPASPGLCAVSGTSDGAEDVIGTLTTALGDTFDARVGRMLHDGEVDFSVLGRKRGIAYLSFSSATGSYGRLTTILVSQAISSLRAEAAANGGTLDVPVYLVLEEFGQLDPIRRLVPDSGIMRAEGIHLLMVLQDRHQLEAKGYSKAEAESLFGMVDDTAVLSINDIDTATMLSKRLGHYTVRTESTSTTRSRRGGSTGSGVQSARRELISPAELTEWSADTGLLLICRGGPYAIPCPDLSQRFVNGLLGMGDEEQNRLIRKAASEALGPERNPGTPPTWIGEADSGAPEAAEGFDPLA